MGREIPTKNGLDSAWWVYKSYADMAGTWVYVDSTGTIEGVAARNDVLKKARVLIKGPISTDSLSVRLGGLRDIDNLVINDVVNVRLEKIRGDSVMVAGDWVQPFEVFDERRLVFGDSLQIELIGLEASDAITIELTPIQPESTIAPG